ncbi:hypothetical protein DRQ33_05230 [bacterium]|nr:MAG: hypothetical protein DRQ33_05230 [bacterium]
MAINKVFITGIEGFVGGYLLEELLNAGYRVGGLYYRNASVQHLNPYDIPLYPGDVSDRRENYWFSLDEFAPDAVVHLSAITFVPQANQDPLNTWQVNLIGTLNLLEWARQKKPDTKLLLISSGEIYGAPKDKHSLPFSEDSCINPQNIYATTKASMDMGAQQYITIWDMPIILARPFNHIGPRQSANFVTSAFAKQIAQIADGKKEPIVRVGNLSAQRDFTDVRDVVRAYRLLLQNVDTGVFNVCSGNPVKIQNILDILIELSGIDVDVQTDPERLRPIDVPQIYGSHQKITDAVNWKPQIPLKQSLEDILNWWKDNV